MLLIHDMSHRCWNDMQLALSDASLWVWCMLSMVVINLDHGPWESQAWWAKAKQAVSEYVAVATHECPIFQCFLPRICKEMAVEVGSLDEATSREIFDTMPAVFQHQFEKSGHDTLVSIHWLFQSAARIVVKTLGRAPVLLRELGRYQEQSFLMFQL